MSRLTRKYKVITPRNRITPAELRCWLDLHGWRQLDLVMALGVSSGTVNAWCTGKYRTPPGLHDELTRFGRPYPPNDNPFSDPLADWAAR